MLDWIFPRICALCGEPSGTAYSLCPACMDALPRVEAPVCLHCGTPLPGASAQAEMCAECSEHERTFDFARSTLSRSEEARRLVIDLKYHGRNHLVPALADLMAGTLQTDPLLRTTAWTLVPIPMTSGRMHRRGYNQSLLLAKSLGKRLGFGMAEPLVHLRDAMSQTALLKHERARHADTVYRVSPAYVAGRKTIPAHLLLIDDVFTTGATARACARQLRRLPDVRTVAVLTLMRA